MQKLQRNRKKGVESKPLRQHMKVALFYCINFLFAVKHFLYQLLKQQLCG